MEYFNTMKMMMIDIYNNMEPLNTEILYYKRLMGLSEGLNLVKKPDLKKTPLPEDVADALDSIILQYWDDERINFESFYDFEIPENMNYDSLIQYCEQNNMTHHIFYSILKIHQYFTR